MHRRSWLVPERNAGHTGCQTHADLAFNAEWLQRGRARGSADESVGADTEAKRDIARNM